MDAVKDVLEDEEKMKKVCAFKQDQLDNCVEKSKIRFRLTLLIENANFEKQNFSHVPDDLLHLFDKNILLKMELHNYLS